MPRRWMPSTSGASRPFRQISHRLLIQRGLAARQRTERRHFRLVGQVRDDAFVRLQPPQYVRPHQTAQRGELVLVGLRTALEEGRELPGAAQQAGTEEVEERPQIRKPVFNRRSAQRNPVPAAQFSHGPALARARILDRLRLVQNGQAPVDFLEPGQSNGHRVTRDDKVRALQRFCRVFARLGEFLVGSFRRMGVKHRQRRRKLLNLGFPVGNERGWHNQQARPDFTAGRLWLGPPALEDQQEAIELEWFCRGPCHPRGRPPVPAGS